MKCLVTKLKSNVNDNTLKKLGEFKTNSVNERGFVSMKIAEGKTVTLNAYGGNFETPVGEPLGNTLNASGSITAYITAGSVLSVMPKYDIAQISEMLLPFSLDELDYVNLESAVGVVKYDLCGGDFKNLVNLCLNATEVQIKLHDGNCKNTNLLGSLKCQKLSITNISSNDEIDVSSLGNLSNITHITCFGTSIGSNVFVGNISSLRNLNSLQRLIMSKNKELTGDISSLSLLTNCKEIIFDDNANISGSLDSLIEGLRSNGASGTFKFNFANTKVLYQGSPMTGLVTVEL